MRTACSCSRPTAEPTPGISCWAGSAPMSNSWTGPWSEVFRRQNVDPARVAVGGFSDGASYALTLGLANGDLFSRVVAFSPGFVADVVRRGSPRFFVSHGTRDTILPIETCGRRIAREFRGLGYDVRFLEFDGGHAVPPDVAEAAMDWLVRPA